MPNIISRKMKGEKPIIWHWVHGARSGWSHSDIPIYLYRCMWKVECASVVTDILAKFTSSRSTTLSVSHCWKKWFFKVDQSIVGMKLQFKYNNLNLKRNESDNVLTSIFWPTFTSSKDIIHCQTILVFVLDGAIVGLKLQYKEIKILVLTRFDTPLYKTISWYNSATKPLQ